MFGLNIYPAGSLSHDSANNWPPWSTQFAGRVHDTVVGAPATPGLRRSSASTAAPGRMRISEY